MDDHGGATRRGSKQGLKPERKRPYIIGLTGNIATGKTTVMSMMHHLGARVIDADQLAHDVMASNPEVRHQIVDVFGTEILDESGQIVRGRLAEIVFDDPKALARLEAIVHPPVLARTQQLIAAAREPVVAVEAIKLIEAGLADQCDTLWVVTCRRRQQIRRLVEQRYLSEDQARRRVQAQPPQAEKIFRADVVIDNSGTLEETWEQVRREWQKIAAQIGGAAPAMQVRRATREDVPAVARFLARLDWRGKPPNEDAALVRIMGRAHVLMLRDGQVVALSSWEAINLVACIEEMMVAPEPDAGGLLCSLAAAVEGEARILDCEVAIATFAPGMHADWDAASADCGYKVTAVSRLAGPWRDAVEEVAPSTEQVFVKRLR